MTDDGARAEGGLKQGVNTAEEFKREINAHLATASKSAELKRTHPEVQFFAELDGLRYEDSGGEYCLYMPRVQDYPGSECELRILANGDAKLIRDPTYIPMTRDRIAQYKLELLSDYDSVCLRGVTYTLGAGDELYGCYPNEAKLPVKEVQVKNWQRCRGCKELLFPNECTHCKYSSVGGKPKRQIVHAGCMACSACYYSLPLPECTTCPRRVLFGETLERLSKEELSRVQILGYDAVQQALIGVRCEADYVRYMKTSPLEGFRFKDSVLLSSLLEYASKRGIHNLEGGRCIIDAKECFEDTPDLLKHAYKHKMSVTLLPTRGHIYVGGTTRYVEFDLYMKLFALGVEGEECEGKHYSVDCMQQLWEDTTRLCCSLE